MEETHLEFSRDDWEARYREEHTLWDLGGPHPELAARLEKDLMGRRRHGHDARAYVPGCGRGYDAVALAEAGWRVTAVDLVDGLEELLQPILKLHASHFVAADALEFNSHPGFELLWEHTFFCALPPACRPIYGEMARRVVPYRGHLAAIVFPVDKPTELGGPPYRTTVEDLAEALGEGFKLIESGPVDHPVTRRAWREEFAVFERLDTDDDLT